MKLTDAKLDSKYKIISLNCLPEVKRRLLELGFVPNNIITPVFASPFGNPIAYQISGTIISLRNEESEKIEVEKID